MFARFPDGEEKILQELHTVQSRVQNYGYNQDQDPVDAELLEAKRKKGTHQSLSI